MEKKKTGRPLGKVRETATYNLKIDANLMNWVRAEAEERGQSLRVFIEKILDAERTRRQQEER